MADEIKKGVEMKAIGDRKTADSSNARSRAQARRDFILDRAAISPNREVTDAEIVAEGKKRGVNWGVSAQSLKDDADYFKLHRHPIVRLYRQNKFVFNNEHQFPYEIRKDYMKEQKRAIGQLAADLIRGAREPAAGVRFTGRDIIGMLEANHGLPDGKDPIRRLCTKLKSIYEKYERLCCLDSGTTTLQAAEVFRSCYEGEILPDPLSSMKALTFLTNSTDIAWSLSRVKAEIQVIMLGGRLRKETQAYAGSMARACIAAWNMNLDISMVGSIGVKRPLGGGTEAGKEIRGFMSDTFEEVEVKQALLSRSMVRVILIDSWKIRNDVTANDAISVGHFTFANLNCDEVDLLITDTTKGIEDEVEQCAKNGVAVLSAEKCLAIEK